MYHIKQISEIVGGRLVGSEDDRIIQNLLIDSRRLDAAGQTLFFALVSQRNDGHKYIEDLYQNGVRAFVVSKMPEEVHSDACYLLVDDVLKALQQLAAYHRSQFNIPVIGITGSNGKTIVKEWRAQPQELQLSSGRSTLRMAYG